MAERIRTDTFGITHVSDEFKENSKLLDLDEGNAPVVNRALEQGNVLEIAPPRSIQDFTSNSRNVVHGVSLMTHVTLKEHVDSILGMDRLIAQWHNDSPRPIMSSGGLSVFFIAEKRNYLKAQGSDLPLFSQDEKGKNSPNYTLLIFSPKILEHLVLYNGYGRDEYVPKKAFVYPKEQIIQQHYLDFLSQASDLTAVEVSPFLLATLPITLELQQSFFEVTTQLPFELTFKEVARRLTDTFIQLDQSYGITFTEKGYRGDDIHTLSTLWAHTLIQDYWKHYSVAVERLISDPQAQYTKQQKTQIFHMLYLQLGNSHLQTDWHLRYEILRSKDLIDQINTNEDISIFELFLNEPEKQIELISALSEVRFDSSQHRLVRYFPERDHRAYWNSISSNMLGEYVDSHDITIDMDSGIFLDQPKTKVDCVMQAASYDLLNGKVISRFVKEKSLKYGMY